MTTLTISLPCPLGCNRTVAAEGKEIHYCVIRDGRSVSREYVGTLNGVYVCSGGSNLEVETQLNDRVLDLIQQGLTDTPLALLDAPIATDPDDQPEPWPDAGAAIARQFFRDRARFLGVLRQLDRDAWPILATAYATTMSRYGCQVLPEHVILIWRKAVENDVTLPPRVA